MLCLFLVLYGCAPTVGPSPAPEAVAISRPEVKPKTDLSQKLSLLPGGEVRSIEGRQAVVYTAGKLFAADAVLPFPGGTEVLDPLVEMIKEFPWQQWRFVLAAQTEHGDAYDKRLAQQRMALVERYLASRGVDMEKVEFALDAKSEAPLQVLALETQESNSGVGNE
ncbi:MAG: hypothetical protein C0624_13005 [Desulfuromonas sp.]|nr:MAG: hypothetical protein C0624_13005 [Desulfuromonas sp.]